MDESRLRRIEARLELRELVARYSRAIDERDFRALAALFSPDCELTFGETRVARGGAGIAAFYADRLTRIKHCFHVGHDQILEFGSDGAATVTGFVTAHAEMWRDDGAYLAALRYHDHYSNEQGRWLFSSRALVFFYYLPIADYPSALGDRMRMRADPARPAAAGFPEDSPTWRQFWRAADT